MSVEDNKRLVAQRYDALGAMDVERFLAAQTDDVIYNVAGRTPVSGRFQGKDFLVAQVRRLVFDALDFTAFRFSKRWKVVCADAERMVGFMEAEGLARGGERHDRRHCQVFAFRDGPICGVWEFFDTCLAGEALFDNPLARPEIEHASRFRF
jgi:ketosteroid isomerase-like protein